MKILVISGASPFGETYGMGLRIRNIGRLLKKIGDVRFIGLSENQWSEDIIDDIKKEFNSGEFYQLELKKFDFSSYIKKILFPRYVHTHNLKLSHSNKKSLDEAIIEADVVWVHTLRIANIVGRFYWEKAVLDLDDYPSQFHYSVAKNKNSPVLLRLNRLRQSLIWKRREKLVKDRFSSLVVCKKNDCVEFDCPDRTYVVANGFERLPVLRNIDHDTPRLGMIGHFGYRLNWEAIDWFIMSCWPKLREKIPNIQLRLVGRNSEAYSNTLLGITGLGFVDDPAKELSTWNALVAPVFVGGGTSVKIVDAFARKIPVVSTSHGARGYMDTTKEIIHVADDADNFVLGCEKVIHDQAYAHQLAENAWNYFDQHLLWDRMLPQIKQAIENTLKH